MKVRFFISLCLMLTFFVTLASEEINKETTAVNSSAVSNNDKEIKKEEKAEDKKALEDSGKDKVEDEQDYNLKLRNLEEKINSLKDKIFRSKQRLSILQETVLSGSIAGARLTIIHKNQVGKAFKLISAIYYLDEAAIYKKIDESSDLDNKEISVFDGSVVPGPHHISVFLVYQGKGFGFFSYMKGYSFKMKAGHSISVEEGNLMEVTVSPKDKGASAKIDNRLFISFDVARKMFEDTVTDQEKSDSE